MIVVMSAYFFLRGRFPADDWLSFAIIYLAGGIVMALGTWVVNTNESRYEKLKGLKSKRG